MRNVGCLIRNAEFGIVSGEQEALVDGVLTERLFCGDCEVALD